MSQDLALVKGYYPGDGLEGTWPNTDIVGLWTPSKGRRGAVLGPLCTGFGAWAESWMWPFPKGRRVTVESPLPLSLRAKPYKVCILHLTDSMDCLIFLWHHLKRKIKIDCTSQLALLRGMKICSYGSHYYCQGLLIKCLPLMDCPRKSQNCLAVL